MVIFRNKMLNQSDWIISNCTSSLLLRELLLVPIGCSTLARLAAVHPSSAQPPPSPSLGPRSSATRSRKGFVLQNFANFWRARSRLYQNEILKENMRLTAFFKLYKICILLHRCNLKFLAKKSVWKISNFRENSAKNLKMLQNLQTFANFQRCQLDNLVDFEKCCNN